MSHHDFEILEHISSPPPIWEVEPWSTYGTPVCFDHPVARASHEDLSHFPDYINADCSIGHTFWAMRLNMQPIALAQLGMACQTFPTLISNTMLNQVLTLVLFLWALPFLSKWRGLVVVLILHLPSLWWEYLHTCILGLALAFLFVEMILGM